MIILTIKENAVQEVGFPNMFYNAEGELQLCKG